MLVMVRGLQYHKPNCIRFDTDWSCFQGEILVEILVESNKSRNPGIFVKLFRETII